MPLVHLPHPELPAYASGDALLKARSLRDHLLRLRQGLARVFGGDWPRVTLYLLNEADWRSRLTLPYGYPAARVRGELSVFAPKGLPERLHFRILEAFTDAGVSPPGPLTELVDLASGHEYAHALAVGRGLRAGARWADELIANGLWTLGLSKADPETHSRLRRWAESLARLPLSHPRPTRLAEELALAGRSLLACLEGTPRCREALEGLLAESPPPGAVRAMLEPWQRWLRPEGSRETRSRRSRKPGTSSATGEETAPRRGRSS